MRYGKRFGMLGIALAGALGAAGCNHHRGWHHGGNPEKRAEWMADKVADKLDLNDAQKAKFKDVQDAMLSARKEMRAGRKDLHKELITMVKGPELDQARITTVVNERKAIFEKHLPVVVGKLAEFHKSLSDEQKAEAAEFLEKMHERFGEWEG